MKKRRKRKDTYPNTVSLTRRGITSKADKRLRENQPVVTCPHCSKLFHGPMSLKLHIRYNHPTKYKGPKTIRPLASKFEQDTKFRRRIQNALDLRKKNNS